jgi:hypothetical protein
VLRGHAGEPEHVLVLTTLGSPQRHLLRGRRVRSTTPEPPPEPVETTRATLIGAQPLGPVPAPDAWLASADLEQHIDEALEVLNRVLHVHRIATVDPYTREVHRDQALTARIGLGAGDEVAHGRWTSARTAPRRVARPRHHRGPPGSSERFAAVLGGRDAVLAAEELTLRARLDLDRGRWREAALQLRVALEAAIAELAAWSDRGDLAARIAALREERGAVGAAANSALENGLDASQIADVRRVVTRLEAALVARLAAGAG